ncbi:MAG: DNA polymerase III subunit delta [Betaproteobacteria bacterium]|nr:DNA polymerase III subunit delta [Betaproteobacteria bacterium]NDF49733.1 DNA polymerase III subunit delta [Betaproteobacteria bacterium]
MKPNAQSLESRLQRAKPPAWLMIHGEEKLLQIEAADRIRAWLRSLGFTDRDVIEVDRFFKLEQLERAVRSRDLFASAKLIELRFTAKPHQASIEWLLSWAKEADHNVCIMIACGKLERSQLQSHWFHDLQAAGWAIEAATVPRAGLNDWIRQRLARESRSASDEVIELIASSTEGNLLACAQEIKKLAMLTDSQIELSLAQQSLANAARWSSFDLQASCLLGDRKRALMILDALHAEAEPAPLILWALADAARQLQALNECLESGQPRRQAFRQLRLFSNREAQFNRALDRIDAPHSLRLLDAAARIDRAIKGIGGLGENPQEAMRDLVLQFTVQSPARDRLLAAGLNGAEK